MSLNTSQNQQQQQPADLGSEASFGQENVLRELSNEPSDIQSYLRSLKEKQMAQIGRVFKSHSAKLEESEREITQSLREIQVQKDEKQREEELIQKERDQLKFDEEHYKRLLSVKPQTVEEIREKVKLQLTLQQRGSSTAAAAIASTPTLSKLNILAQDSKPPVVSVASPPKNKKKKKVIKGTLWYYENREKAEYEFALREFLKNKELSKYTKPVVPKTFQPIIIKPEERRKYDEFRELDYEAATPCSEDRSNFAFETGNDILANFKQIFENLNMSSTSKGAAIRRKRYRIKDFRDDELRLIAHLFARIPNHEVDEAADPNADYVRKEDFQEELLSMREILILYNLRPEDLGKEITKFNTSRAGYMNLREAGEFLTLDRDSQGQLEQQKRFKRRTTTEESTGYPKSLLNEVQIATFRDIFMEIDTFGELKVSLKQLIHKIRTDARTIDWIEQPAALVKEVGRYILLEEIFNEWDQWLAVGKEPERRAKESIDWSTFEEMILNYKKKDIPSRDKIFAAQKLLGRYDFGDTIEVPKEFLKAIKDTIASLPKYADNYVNTTDFIADLKANKSYTLAKSKFVREKKYLDLEIETIDDVLRRMDSECEDYHTQDEILEFFSRKGRPKYLARSIRLQKQQALLNKQNGLSDSEDSDDGKDAKKNLKDKRKQRKVAKILGSSEEDAKKKLQKNKFMLSKQNFGAQFKSKDEEYIVTVPEPFAFDSRDKVKVVTIREKKLKEMLQVKKDEEDYLVQTATAFRANKIPKHIKNTKLQFSSKDIQWREGQKEIKRDLWSQIMAKNNERREQVKKESKAITLSQENPFTFYYRDLQKVKDRKNALPEKFKINHFKAKHAPWTSLVHLYDRLLERQAKRTKENVEKRRAELAETSKLPEGVRSMLKRLKAKDEEMEQKRNNRLEEHTFQPPRAKPVPNFSELQKQFNDRLAEKKQDYTPTVSVPFKFQETRKGVSRDYLDKENLQTKISSEGSGKNDREKRLKRILTMKVKLQPPSTKKFEALVQKNRQVQEQKEYNKMVTESRELDKNLRREKFAEFVNSCIRNVNHSEYRNQLNALKDHQRNEKLQQKYEWEQQFDEKMTEMMRNVIRRPLLVEQVTQKDFSSERARQHQMMLEAAQQYGEAIQEEMEGEDEEGIYVPNFDQMTEQELRQYLDPSSVDPKTLEYRKYAYFQHIQRSAQMPDINEMDDEDEDPNQGNDYDPRLYAQQQGIEDVSQQEGEENGGEYDEEGEDVNGGQEQEGEDEGHDQGNDDDDDEDFHQNQEFLEQQKQVQQIQQQQMNEDDDEEEDDYNSQNIGLAQVSSSGGRNSSSQQQQQDSHSLQSSNKQKGAAAATSDSIAPSSSQQQQQQQHGDSHNEAGQLDDDEDDDEDDDQYEYQDEYGNPIPAHLVREYKQRMREMGQDPDAQFDYEDGDEDFPEDDEDVEYVDQEGNVIPPEMVAELKNQRKLEIEKYREQMAQAEYQQQNQQANRKSNLSGQSSVPPVAVAPASAPGDSKNQQDNSMQKQHSAHPSGSNQAVVAAAAVPQSPGHSDYEVDENGQPVMMDDDEEDGEPAYIQTQSQPEKDHGGVDDHMEEYDEEFDEEYDEDKYDYVDENGNPIDPKVIQYLKEQKQQQQQQQQQLDGNLDDEDLDDDYDDHDPDAQPLGPAAPLPVPVATASAAAASKVDRSGDSKNKSRDSYVEERQIAGEEDQEIDEDEMMQQDGEGDEEEEEEVYYDQYNQRIPPEEVKRYKEMAARGEIDMEEYDEDGEEPQFESAEEQIEYYVDLQMKEFKKQGKKVSEAEVRQMITEQLLAEQEQQDELNEQLEEAIAQMTPEELAQFVDESGRQMSKDQIKQILMQQQAEDEYYEGEEGFEQEEDDDDDQPNNYGRQQQQQQQQLKHNSSF